MLREDPRRPTRTRTARLRLRAAVAIGLLLPGCSFAVTHGNGGIGLLENATSPVRQAAVAAKVLGWIVGVPAALAMAPFALLAWATPWVDLPTAVDIATAPAVGLGYATQAVVGFPLYGAFAWAADRPGQGLEPTGGSLRRRPLDPVPWGMVAARRPLQEPAREPEPLPAPVAERYAVPAGESEALGAALAAATPDGDGIRRVRLARMAGTLEWTAAQDEDAEGPRRAVIMTPPTQAIFAARWLAGRYARAGWHAAVVIPDAVFLEPSLDPAGIERKLRETVIGARVLVQSLLVRPDVAGVRYLGISAGGIFGAMLLPLEPRIERAVLIFPGGDLATLVAGSDEGTVTAYREAWASRGLDRGGLRTAFAREVQTDPLRLARHVDPRRVVLFLSADDSKVPTQGQLALRRALGSPEAWLLSGNHDSSGVCFGAVLRAADSFLLAD